MREIRLDAYEKELIGIAGEIIGYLMKSGVPGSQAQDVVQDVFVQLLEAEVILPADKIRAWMYRTAVRRYIDLYRRDRKYQEILQKEFIPQEQLQRADEADFDFLYTAIQHLKSSYQEVLDLYYLQGFSMEEIRQVTGRSISSIKVTLMRGRQVLKKQLEKDGYDHGDL